MTSKHTLQPVFSLLTTIPLVHLIAAHPDTSPQPQQQPQLQPGAMTLPSPSPSPRPKHHATLGLAFGLSTVLGILSLVACIALIWVLRLRHKKRKARGIMRETQDESGKWCICKECSGCVRKRGGGDGSQPCWKCRDEVCAKVVEGSGEVGKDGKE